MSLKTEWQPIETAPKLERKTVLGAEDEWVGEMFWHDGSECYGHRGGAGWFSLDDWGSLLTASNVHPTHWMPLPAPPSSSLILEREEAGGETAETHSINLGSSGDRAESLGEAG